MPRFILPVLVALAALPAAVQAQDRAAEIRFQDLDLGSAAGIASLERRIETAANQVCRGEVTTGSRIRAAQREMACRAEIRRQVDARIAAQHN